MKIGIGITTYNRPEALVLTLAKIKAFTPKDFKIVIVDDGSTHPIENATHRFGTNQGTPTAKNKCFELLDDCGHIFLFDDDTYPIVKNWWKPYVESPFPHLNYTFKYPKRIEDGHGYSENPNGCMMYFHKSVLDKVGGFDTGFKYYGYWHGAMSNRIFNAGLNPAPFIDVEGSEKLFVCRDNEGTVKTSRPDRGKFLDANKRRYFDKLHSSEFIPYKSKLRIWYSNPYSPEKNIGKALNEFCELVPNDNDWICLQDGDMMYLTPEWGKQIYDTLVKHGDKYALIGCMTNRLGRDIQRLKGEFSNNMDMMHHYKLAVEQRNKHYGEVVELYKRKYVAGMFMLFQKKTWRKNPFVENSPSFDDSFSKDVVKKGGKVGLMMGLYCFHCYRLHSDKPIGDTAHLK